MDQNAGAIGEEGGPVKRAKTCGDLGKGLPHLFSMKVDFAGLLFSYVHPIEVITALTCVSKSWKMIAEHDSVWQRFVSLHFESKHTTNTPILTTNNQDGKVRRPSVARCRLPPQSIPVGGGESEDGKKAASFKQAWVEWYRLYRRIGQDPVLHGKNTFQISTTIASTWDLLKQWASANLVGAAESLKPTTFEQTNLLVDRAENILGFRLPPALLELWSVFDGQSLEIDDQSFSMPLGEFDRDTKHQRWLGLMGGYSVYNYTVCTRILPLRHAINLTEFLRTRLPLDESMLLICASHNLRKLIFIDAKDGGIYCLNERVQKVLLTPEAKPDSILLWLREYTRRLLEGVYVTAPLVPERGQSTAGINLFPASGDQYTYSVTRGVRIASSSIFMVERTQGWAYSIRMRLINPDEEGYESKEQRGFETCQLSHRHWIIEQEGKDEAQHVTGSGVIGMFPILTEGGWLLNRHSDPNHQYYSRVPGELKEEFVYQSCSGRFPPGKQGSFGGEMTFVPKPGGSHFMCKVESFPLALTEFKY